MHWGCQTIQVPKHLIKEWLPHPEPNGEGIVVFENGMWTDVYVRSDGTIITPTNDRALFRDLRRNKKQGL
jgi:hypothetical protein